MLPQGALSCTFSSFSVRSPFFPAGCCQDLRLDSLGLSHYEQSSRVGEYSYYKTELSGKFTYRQAGGDNFLYYMPDLKIWMVGEELYANYGGILNRNINDCPEGTWAHQVEVGCQS